MTKNYKGKTINVTASFTAKDSSELPDTVTIQTDITTHVLKPVGVFDVSTQAQ